MLRKNILFCIYLIQCLIIKPVFSDESVITETENFIEVKTSHITCSIGRHPSGSIYLRRLSLIDEDGLIHEPDVSWPRGKICPFWQLDLYNPPVSLNSNNSKFSKWTINNNNNDNIELKLEWFKEFPSLVLNIYVNIQIDKSSNRTNWSISVLSRDSKDFIIRKCIFPIIGDIVNSSDKGDIRLAVPAYWGREYQHAEESDYLGIYPSAQANMQFMSYYNTESHEGIYISPNDTEGYYKFLTNHKANSQYPYARAEISLFPQNELISEWTVPISTEVRPYKGGWYEASKYYRNWVINNAPWSIANKLKGNSRLLQNILWIDGKLHSDMEVNFDTSDIVKQIKSMWEYLQVPMVLHLYNWHHYSFDSMYPIYFPARNGFNTFLQEMNGLNISVVPYINGRITDLRVLQNDENLHSSACLIATTDGDTFDKNSYNNNEFVTMCPSSEFWKHTLCSIINKLTNEYGINGFYFDQIGNDAAVKCVSKIHNHFPDPVDKYFYSSGNHWVRGYRDILTSIKNDLSINQQSFFVTENNAEPWNDLFDAFLMIEYRVQDPWHKFFLIPLYPTVYSGYSITIGLGYSNPPIEKYSNILLYKLSLNFLWGSQLGRIHPDQTKQNREVLDYLRKLCQLRLKITNYLNYGEMLQEPILTNISEELELDEMIPDDNFKYKPIQLKISPIRSSFWRLNSDSAAVLVTNFSKNNFITDPVNLTLEISDYGLKKGKYLVKKILSEREETQKLLVWENEIIIPIEIFPFDAIVFEFNHIE